MAFTVAQVTTPNAAQWEGEFLGYKARVVDLTWDNAYDNTNGESLTAASLGWTTIVGCIVIAEPWSGTTTDFALIARPVIPTAQTSVVFRAFRYNGSATGVQPFEEVVTTSLDLSAYTMRVVLIGA